MSCSFKYKLKRTLCLLGSVYFLLHCAAIYLCRSEDGYICFYRDGILTERTAIAAEMLPQTDDKAVSYGIYTPSMAGCTKIAEDFCS